MTVKRAFGLKKALCVLFMCAFNPLIYLCSEYCYTNVWCLPYTSIILYLSVSICLLLKDLSADRDRRKTIKLLVYSALLGVVTAVGFLIRVTSVIPFIAYLCIIVVYLVIYRAAILKKLLCSVGLCALTLAVVLFSLNAYTKSFCESDTNENEFPLTHWVMMSFGENGRYNKDDVALTHYAGDYNGKVKANLAELENRIDEMGLSGLLSNFEKKLTGTWADGTYNVLGRITVTRTENSLYRYLGGEKSDIATMLCQIYHVSMLIFVLISCIAQLRKKRFEEFSFLSLLSLFGGILFYLFWEVSATYSLPFIFILVMAANDGLVEISRVFELTADKKHTALHRGVAIMFAIVFTVSAIGCVRGFKPLCKDESVWRDYSVYNYSAVSDIKYLSDISSGGIKQEFYSSTEFNKLYINCKATGKSSECQYQLDLLDENGEALFSAQFTESNIQSGIISFNFPAIKTNGREKFALKITQLTNAEGSVAFGYTQTIATDNYDGVFSANGAEQENADLFLNVLNQYSGTYFTDTQYVLLCVALLLVETSLFIWIRIYIDLGKNGGTGYCTFTRAYFCLKKKGCDKVPEESSLQIKNSRNYQLDFIRV